jgi:hypothetical protein
MFQAQSDIEELDVDDPTCRLTLTNAVAYFISVCFYILPYLADKELSTAQYVHERDYHSPVCPIVPNRWTLPVSCWRSRQDHLLYLPPSLVFYID